MAENNQTKSKESKGRGGPRKGAGRKTGSATKRTREIADKAAAEGITPLEVMLKTMRALVTKAEQSDPKNPDVSMMVEASAVAKDAAPYIHPRLAAVEHSGKDGGALDHSLSVTFK
jgi:hypothetical protein